MTTEGRLGAANTQAATVSSGITITGNVDCDAELQINGRVNGEVSAPAVFVETQGEVQGGIVADRLRVAGKVDGAIKVGDLVIEPGGEVRGDVRYGRLKIVAGGIIEGNFTHNGEAMPKTEEKPVKLVTRPEPAASRAESDNPRRVYVD